MSGASRPLCWALVVLLTGAAGGLAASSSDPPDLGRARELSWSGHYDESLALYERILRQHPDDLSLVLEQGRVLLWAGRERAASRVLERVLHADPGDVEARLELARALSYLGRLEPAAGHYRLVIPAFETDAAIVAEAVTAFRRADRPDLAEAWLVRGLRLHPAHPDLRVERAIALAENGEFEMARSELEVVLADHPTHGPAAERLGELHAGGMQLRVAERLANSGRIAEAKRRVRDHLSAHPDDAKARLMLARFAGWSGDYPLSLRTYRTLLATRPKDRALRIEQADVTSWAGRYGEALELYDQLALEDPDDLTPRLGIANVHLWSGVHREADRRLRAILKEDPSHEGALEQLHHLDQLRATTLEPSLGWFQDNEGFTLWTPTVAARLSPRPGTQVVVELDAPQAEGDVFVVDPMTGAFRRRREQVRGQGIWLRLSERPERAWEFGGDLGLATYRNAGMSPRGSLHIRWQPTYRHALRAEVRHEDALPVVRSIRSATESIERSSLQLVHSYQGERLTGWTQLETGRYSDHTRFWNARTVLGLGIVRAPLEIDLLALGSVGDHDRTSPSYYSPQDLLSYAVGVRLKKNLAKRADLLLIAEVGRIREDGATGRTLRIAPELRFQIGSRFEVGLSYDYFSSVRSGAAYQSDYLSIRLRYRFPVKP